jgi:Integrase zinc binding domain
VELLASYDFRIYYQKGTDNRQADALSCRADHQDGITLKPYSILKENSDGTLKYNHRVQASTMVIEDTQWEKDIIQAYKDDSMAKIILETPLKDRQITIQEGLILMDRLIYVLQRLRNEVFKCYHKTRATGHQGIRKTLELIQQMYYFPGIRKYIEEKIRICDSCQ